MNFTHPAAKRTIKSKIFEGINNFLDLEQRISNISTEAASNEKGRVFEVFAEAVLLSIPDIQAKSIWGPVSSAPQSVRRRLNLRPTDKGVDGIIETIDGRFITYQAKFRSGRPKLLWGEPHNLGNTFGLSSKADATLIFTNCDDFVDEVKDQDPMVVNGLYLENLEPEYLQAALALLDASPEPEIKINPDPHQVAAIKDSVRHFEGSDRGQFISACGTGKTFTSFWIAQALRANTVLYLVPSLALVKQTIGEWLKLSEAPFPFLSVCSDIKTARKRDTDELVITQSDLPFAVTTQPEQINDWVKATENFDFRVVFATYDSARAVAAGVGDDFKFELGFFDEAHKTAGTDGTKYNFGLYESNIRIAKRLFMTATPRFVDARSHRKDGELKTLSMDDTEMYGERYHNFSFYEARKAGVIVPFKVHVSTITSQDVNEYARKTSSTEIHGDPIRSEQVARQIALARAQADTGARKILTFHREIKHAESFSSNRSEGIGPHLPNFFTSFVKGSQNVSVRDRILRDFAQSENGLVSNARCLTEGVDVPEIDLIFFSAPKRSVVDIAQAVGRAVRKPRGISEKQAGYVVVPLFREQDESTEEATFRAGFQDIAEVINSLQAHDSELAEILQRMRVKKPKIGGYDPKDLEDYLTITGDIELKTLTEAIVTEVVDSLTPTWDEWYGLLEMHLEKYGVAPEIPPKIKGKKGAWHIGDWCSQQRTFFNLGQLSESRIERLNQLIPIGWTWDPVFTRMLSAARRIKAWCEENEQWHVPDRTELGSAYRSIIKSFKDGALQEEIIELLEGIKGWYWGATDDKVWELKFDWYRDWCISTKRILPLKNEITVSNIYGVNAFDLRGWMDQQSQRYFARATKKHLLPEQIRRFEQEIPFWAWTEWERMFRAYLAAREEFGDIKSTNKPGDFPFLPEELRSVARWQTKQRSHQGINNYFLSNRLQPEFLFQLEASGFDFAPFEKIWHRGYMLLLDEVYGLVGQSSEVNDIKGQVSGFWRGFKNPKGNDKAIVSLRQDDEKDGVTLGLWITKNREDIKQLPATLNFPNRQRLLAQIPGWYRNPSDYRTVDYEDAKKEQIELLWESYKDDQELAVVFLYALYAGLRLHEMLTAEVFHIKNRSYIEIKPSKGSAAYRRVPLHPKLRHVPLEFTSTYGAISARLSKKKNRSLKATTHITSLNYALYAELINRGIDSLDLVALTHGKEETFWDDAVNTRLLNLFKKVEF